MTNLRRIQILFLVVVITTPIFVIVGYLLDPDNFMAGIGVEFLGAWLTAGGVIGLEHLLSVPDDDVIELKAKIEAQKTQLTEVQTKLDQLLAKFAEKEAADD